MSIHFVFCILQRTVAERLQAHSRDSEYPSIRALSAQAKAAEYGRYGLH